MTRTSEDVRLNPIPGDVYQNSDNRRAIVTAVCADGIDVRWDTNVDCTWTRELWSATIEGDMYIPAQVAPNVATDAYPVAIVACYAGRPAQVFRSWAAFRAYYADTNVPVEGHEVPLVEVL